MSFVVSARGLHQVSTGELKPIQEAAEELGVHVTTLYRLRREGKLHRQPKQPRDKRSYVDMGEARNAVAHHPKVQVDAGMLRVALSERSKDDLREYARQVLLQQLERQTVDPGEPPGLEL